MKEELFQKYHKEIYEHNLLAFQRISFMGLCISAVLVVLSLPFIHVLKLFPAYLALFVVFSIIYTSSKSNWVKDEAFVLRFFYLLIIFLLLIGILMGTYLGTTTNAITFFLFLLVLPSFIVDRPHRLIILVIVMSILFCVIDIQAKTGEILRLDLSNCIVVCCVFVFLIRMNVQNKLNDIVARDELRHKAQMEHDLKQAKSATSAKSEFLSRMSHDIRTPMNAIIGITSLAMDEVNNPEAIKEYLNKVNSSSRYLLGLVNDCLDMEKIESRNMVLNPVAYTYEEFYNSISTLIRPLCEEKNITFDFKIPNAPYTIFVDKVRFEQIFINLLSNAVKFTPEGGHIEFVDDNAQREGNILHNHYMIRDNGIGMSKEFQKKLFQPFTQESNAVLPQSQGTGLGLSIVKNIVEMMNGHIEIQSEQGVGTRIDVYLDFPLLLEEEKKRQKENQDKMGDLKGKQILLMEDHPLNIEIATKLLEKKGCIVTCAVNGKMGVDIFKASDEGYFDVILTDVRMPEMDGLEATRIIRGLNRKDASKIPMIAMTANAYEEDAQKSMEAGMNEHLAKPIEPDKLYETIGRYV